MAGRDAQKVLVKDGEADIIRSREDIQDLMAGQTLPARLM